MAISVPEQGQREAPWPTPSPGELAPPDMDGIALTAGQQGVRRALVFSIESVQVGGRVQQLIARLLHLACRVAVSGISNDHSGTQRHVIGPIRPLLPALMDGMAAAAERGLKGMALVREAVEQIAREFFYDQKV